MRAEQANAAADALSPGSAGQRGKIVFLTVMFLLSVNAYVDRSIMALVLEPIKAEFALSDAELGLLSGGAFAIVYAVLGVPIGRWVDRGNRKLILVLSAMTWSVMTMASGFAASFWSLVGARIGVGAGEAGLAPATQSLVVDNVPARQRAQAISLLFMSSVAGTFLTFVLGGMAVDYLGWRWTLIAVGAPGAVIALIAAIVLREPQRATPIVQGDLAESFAAALSALGRKRSFIFIVCALTLYALLHAGVLSFIVSFLIRAHGVSAAQAGLIVGIAPSLGAMAGSLAGGVIADRLARLDQRYLLWFPALALGACAPLLAWMYLTAELSLFTLLLSAVLFCLMCGVPTIYTALHSVCGGVRRGTAVAVAMLVSSLVGQTFGPLGAGVLSDMLAPAFGSAAALRWACVALSLTVAPLLVVALLKAAQSLLHDREV